MIPFTSWEIVYILFSLSSPYLNSMQSLPMVIELRILNWGWAEIIKPLNLRFFNNDTHLSTLFSIFFLVEFHKLKRKGTIILVCFPGEIVFYLSISLCEFFAQTLRCLSMFVAPWFMLQVLWVPFASCSF